jgi:hypothetical protein
MPRLTEESSEDSRRQASFRACMPPLNIHPNAQLSKPLNST